jgi:hypothetical protein
MTTYGYDPTFDQDTQKNTNQNAEPDDDLLGTGPRQTRDDLPPNRSYEASDEEGDDDEEMGSSIDRGIEQERGGQRRPGDVDQASRRSDDVLLGRAQQPGKRGRDVFSPSNEELYDIEDEEEGEEQLGSR